MTDEPLEEPEEREYVVPAELDGQRLDQAVTQLASDLSRAAAQRLIGDGLCLLNDRVPKRADRVTEGDRISLTILPPEPTDVAAEEIPLDVAYEDRDLIVINKPSGMVVHPAAGNPRGTLVNALLAHCRDLSGIGGELRPGIVHRLDKETSGLLVAAKSDAAHRGLAKQIAGRSAKRTYWALVWGEPSPGEGRVSAPIARHPRQRQMMAVVPGGREATTHYRVLETFRVDSERGKQARTVSLVELDLETGRTHQIRVHLSHIGHPVLGDPVYGKQRSLPQSASPELQLALEGLQGQALHARKLRFVHPVTGQPMVFEAEPPEDFVRVLEALRLD
jgi:23S rRNA pseudouridine1911/1915/1917 synthase